MDLEIFLRENATWHTSIEVKYRINEEGWFTKHLRRSYGDSLWKAISKEYDFFKQYSRLHMGKATEIRLWGEKWCGQIPLCDSYPSPYMTANTKGPKLLRFGWFRESGELGIQIFLGISMIGKWKLLLLSWMWLIGKGWPLIWWIKFSGNEIIWVVLLSKDASAY